MHIVYNHRNYLAIFKAQSIQILHAIMFLHVSSFLSDSANSLSDVGIHRKYDLLIGNNISISIVVCVNMPMQFLGICFLCNLISLKLNITTAKIK